MLIYPLLLVGLIKGRGSPKRKTSNRNGPKRAKRRGSEGGDKSERTEIQEVMGGLPCV